MKMRPQMRKNVCAHGSKRSAEGAFSFSEIIKLNVKIERMLRSGCHSVSRHGPCIQIEGIKRGHTSENGK